MKKILLTITVAAVAITVSTSLYLKYHQNPWTRDSQVRANVVQITPRVTGEIVDLRVKDNSRVKQGDLLFVIDPKPYKVALQKARAAQAQAQAQFNKTQNEYLRTQGLEKRSPGSVSALALSNYHTAVKAADANLAAAKAAVKQAELNLSYTEVVAPNSGFLTNLHHHLGSQVVANSPVVALIDEGSFWIEAFFKETDLSNIKVGEEASVILLSDQSLVLDGHVESIGYGIAKSDGSVGNSLLPNVNPNFQWIRLAQRLPVRIKLVDVPKEVQLRVGTTASVKLNQ